MHYQTLQTALDKENGVSTSRVLSDIDAIIKAFDYFKSLIEENHDDPTIGAECTNVLADVKTKIIEFACFVSLFINRFYSSANAMTLSDVRKDVAEFTCFAGDLLNVEMKEEVAL